MQLNRLQHEIGTLSVPEKYELLDALWESLASSDYSLTEIQREEIDRRLELYKRNPDNVTNWEVVRTALLKNQ